MTSNIYPNIHNFDKTDHAINSIRSNSYNSYLPNSLDISPKQTMIRLQSILQLHLFRNFSTGNFFLDTMFQLFLMILLTYMLIRINSISDYSYYCMNNITYYIYKKIVNIYNKLIGKVIE